MRKHSILIIVVLCSVFANAQLKYNRVDSIIVTLNSDTLQLPWAGGFNNPQFSEIDLNFDGIMDLFVYEKDGNTVKTFINQGDGGKSSYVYTTDYLSLFPEPKNFVLLRDYNCDGKMDFFTGTTGGLKVYKNVSNEILGLKFEMITSLLKSDYNPNMLNLYVPSTDIPVIDDLDNDGDIDILTFGVVGTTVEHHENLSMDTYGTCDSLKFRLVNSCWGNFSENALDNGVTLGISCKGNTGTADTTQRGSRHSGSTLLTIDLDNDGDKEFISGDVSYNNLIMLTNGGDNITANMIAFDNQFPSVSNPVNIPIFPAGFYLDLNNDSLKDLVVAATARNISENTNGTWYYKNIGSNEFPIFSLVNQSFLQEDMIEVGSGANPVFFDANVDGLMDIVVGNYGYYNSSSSTLKSKLLLLENTGTSTLPSFKIKNIDYQNISSLGVNGLYPSFGDMDNDGDLDMIIGDSNGLLYYYTNNAGAGNTASFTLTSSNYMGIDVGYFATPFIIDFNKDGLNDLLIGERAGTIKYFQNIGTTSNASFNNSPTVDTLGGIDVMKLCCTGYSNVSAYFDNDNKLNMYIGSEKGIIYQYRSITTDLLNYELLDSIITDGHRVNASLADIDGKTNYEIVSGHYAGGISLYSKTSLLSLISPQDHSTGLDDTLTLDWSSVEAADFYQVQIDTTYHFNSSLLIDSIIPFINNNGDGPDTQLDLFTLTPNQTYFWRARIISETDSSNWTSVWDFKISPTGDHQTNIIEKINSNIKVYPNPTSDIVHIDVNNSNALNSFILIDITGKIIVSKKLLEEKNTIDLSTLSSGIYFGIIKDNSEILKTVKILKH